MCWNGAGDQVDEPLGRGQVEGPAADAVQGVEDQQAQQKQLRMEDVIIISPSPTLYGVAHQQAQQEQLRRGYIYIYIYKS